MIHLETQVNTPVLCTIMNPTGQSGSLPTDTTLLFNGTVVMTPTVTVTDVGVKGLYNFSFTPQATGSFVLYAYGNIVAQVDVVTTSVYSYLQDLEDEALGSWVWDKTAGTLNLLRRDGTNLAAFTVVDNLTTASRELVG